MGAKKKLLQVKEAFRLAQKPHQNHAKLVVALKSTYDQVRLAAGGAVTRRAEGRARALGTGSVPCSVTLLASVGAYFSKAN